MCSRLTILVMAVICGWSWTATAMEPIPGEERFAGIAEDQPHSAGAELGFAGLAEDYFLQLTLRTALNFGKVGVGLQVPLNLRVVDRKPKNDDDYYGLIRHEDWDESTEWLRVLRYVRYGHKHSDDWVFVQVGELAAEVGHGTIMTRYLNNIDLNAFRLGSQIDVYTPYGGLETVVSDYGSFAPEAVDSRIVGGRLYLKPYAWVDAESALNIFALGFTFVSDLNAPRRLQTDESTGALALDRDNPLVDRAAAANVWGLDAEVQLLNTDMLKLTPYSDLNFIAAAGWGWHLGTLFTFRFPIGFELTIPVRLEYRRFRSDYVPSYFSTFYELERFIYPVGSQALQPKARVVRQLPDDEGINGYYGDLAFNFAGLLQLGVIYEGYQGQYPNLAAFLAVPALESLQFKAYYTRTRVAGADDLFKLDERSMVIAQARYQLASFMYLVGRWSRRWAMNTDADSKTYGTFQPADDWKLGIEASFDF